MYFAVTKIHPDQNVGRFIERKYATVFDDADRGRTMGRLYHAFYRNQGPMIPYEDPRSAAKMIAAGGATMKRQMTELMHDFDPAALLVKEQKEKLAEPAVLTTFLKAPFAGHRAGCLTMLVRTNLCEHCFIFSDLIFDRERMELRRVTERQAYTWPALAVPPFVASLGDKLLEAAGGEAMGRFTEKLFPRPHEWVTQDYEQIRKIVDKSMDEFKLQTIHGQLNDAGRSMQLYARMRDYMGDPEDARRYLDQAREELQHAVSLLGESDDVALYLYSVAMTQYLLVLFEFANTSAEIKERQVFKSFGKHVAQEGEKVAERMVDQLRNDRFACVTPVKLHKRGWFSHDFYRWEDTHNHLVQDYEIAFKPFGEKPEMARKRAENARLNYLKALETEVTHQIEPPIRLVHDWQRAEDRVAA